MVHDLRLRGLRRLRRCLLRSRPADLARQERLSRRCAVAQSGGSRRRPASSGARLTHASIHVPHRELRIEARSRCASRARKGSDPAGSDPGFETVRAIAAESRQRRRARAGPCAVPEPGRADPPGDHRLRGRRPFPQCAGVFAGAADLMTRIRDDFAYAPARPTSRRRRSTPSRPAPGSARLRPRHDRGPARAGPGPPATCPATCARSRPRRGAPRRRGRDSRLGRRLVRAGSRLDRLRPDERAPRGPDHIVLAFGRDYSDVSPVDGVVVSSGGQSLTVSVDVAPEAAPAA